MSATKRNRLTKENAIIILENSTALPFKWHRQNYLCFFCHRAFKDTDSLKLHTKGTHEHSNTRAAVSYLRRDEKAKIDITNLLCRICDNKFDQLNSFLDHLKAEHKIFYNNGFGLGVIPYKMQSGNFQCAECGEQFLYFIKLNEHMNRHYGSYICELCGKSFLSQDRLRCHALSHGSGYRCHECDEIFDSLTLKKQHETKVHKIDKTLKCFYCPEKFQNYLKRKIHHHEKHNIEICKYNCPVCGKVFDIMSKMKAHLNEVHVREKNFACTMCDQRFFSKTLVRKHMIKHLGERIYRCELCNKSYPRKQTLRDHKLRLHSSIKRFICSVCCQGFVLNKDLRSHMKVRHPENLDA